LGALFVLSFGDNYLAMAVLYIVFTWVVEGLLVARVWSLQEYMLNRGIRFAGGMLAVGWIGRDFEKSLKAAAVEEEARKRAVEAVNTFNFTVAQGEKEDFTKAE
jgi:hypothetical protein